MRKIMLCAAVAGCLGGAAAAQPKIAPDQLNNWDTLMKLYPKRALVAREQGLVGFNLTLDRNGHPTECQVTHSSGYRLLDNETCEVLIMHAEYKRPKDAEGNNMALFRTQGVINWRLPGAETKLVSPTKVAKLDPLEKKICKRTPRTGSLAGFDRTCMTVRQWDSQRRESVDSAAEMQGRKGFTADPAVSGADPQVTTTWGTPH